jgi:hypothetical protein
MRLAYVSIPRSRFVGPVDIAYPKYVQKLLQNIQIGHLDPKLDRAGAVDDSALALEQTGGPSDLRVFIVHISRIADKSDSDMAFGNEQRVATTMRKCARDP